MRHVVVLALIVGALSILIAVFCSAAQANVRHLKVLVPGPTFTITPHVKAQEQFIDTYCLYEHIGNQYVKVAEGPSTEFTLPPRRYVSTAKSRFGESPYSNEVTTNP